MNFVIQKSYDGRERRAVEITYDLLYGSRHGRIDYSDDPNEFPDSIPLGSVEFVEKRLGKIKPDYYPEWTRGHWYRKIWYESPKKFIKSADSYKKLEGKLLEDHLDYDGKLICSDPVNFVDEWRYYISNGKEICSWWYKGNYKTSEYEPNGRLLPFDVPKDFCGAIDMGLLDTGEYALVEVQHPYAIGWYGEMYAGEGSCYGYTRFLINGWKYLQNERNSKN